MRDKKKHNQTEIRSALKAAQKSTQSAGVYDKRFKEEKALRKIRKDKPLNDFGKEVDRNMKLLDRLNIDDQKLRLTKSVQRKFGGFEAEQDEKKLRASFKKKLEKEQEKRTRKTTLKRHKKKGTYKK